MKRVVDQHAGEELVRRSCDADCRAAATARRSTSATTEPDQRDRRTASILSPKRNIRTSSMTTIVAQSASSGPKAGRLVERVVDQTIE